MTLTGKQLAEARRLQASAGGKASAAALTPEQRTERAKKARQARTEKYRARHEQEQSTSQ